MNINIVDCKFNQDISTIKKYNDDKEFETMVAICENDRLSHLSLNSLSSEDILIISKDIENWVNKNEYNIFSKIHFYLEKTIYNINSIDFSDYEEDKFINHDFILISMTIIIQNLPIREKPTTLKLSITYDQTIKEVIGIDFINLKEEKEKLIQDILDLRKERKSLNKKMTIDELIEKTKNKIKRLETRYDL